jgi:hypothetical protein
LAALRFAPISPACGMKRNIRDCSGHDGQRGRIEGKIKWLVRTVRFASASEVRSDQEKPR